ncbi:MAG: serine/threonine-protein kinase [Polyangiales bacterium]
MSGTEQTPASQDRAIEPESAPTLVDVRPRSAPPALREGRDMGTGAGSKTGGTQSTSVITARETLHIQEIAQTRAFVRLAMALAVVVAIFIFFLGGDRTARTILHAFLGGVVLSCGWLAWSLRHDEGYKIEKVLVCAFVCVSAAFAAVYYFGVFSPAVVIIPFGLCFFSAGASTRGTLGVLLLCALIELFLGASIAAGALPDRGIVRAEHVSAFEKLAIVTLIEAIFLATYLIMRASRAATLHAIELHDQALAQVSQREALLKEARQDLRAALEAGGLGRYSDHTIGSFKLGRVIGRGAMGEVYEGQHVATREQVAVKVLLDHVLAQPEHVQRFYREAKIASTLTVPNVVKVLGVADIDAPIPYIAMERLHGVDLADWLREHRRMSFGRLLSLIRQIGVGLDAARAAGIVHRDLKPRNVFLAKKGEGETWKILDFGVSKLTSDDNTLTRDRIVGTPTYMAPEQIDRGKVNHRTDLFALGIIAYRALTGRPAFSGDSEAQILYRVVHSMPPRPSELLSVTAEVDFVMAVALAKDPEDRFDSANELATALHAASEGRIDPNLAARAQKILSRHPWGA